MSYKCQSPVLLIFFNRSDTFKRVFEQVRKAKPAHLILAQDGPRSRRDNDGILACRSIAEQVDWECEITRDYSEVNLGCGVRPQSAISKALDLYDRVIILEDDCIPTDSFFRYCDEMLKKYEDDNRIAYISGLNHFGEWDCGKQDYFFTKTGAIWGWATWRRSWGKYYDYTVAGIEEPYVLHLAQKQITNNYISVQRADSWRRANRSKKNGEKLTYWDSQWGFVKYSQNMLVAVPKYNQIYNIGYGENSTHAQKTSHSFSKRQKDFFCIPTRELDFPLKHADFLLCDEDYDALVYQILAGNPVRRVIARTLKNIQRILTNK